MSILMIKETHISLDQRPMHYFPNP